MELSIEDYFEKIHGKPKDKHDQSSKKYDYWDMLGFAEGYQEEITMNLGAEFVLDVDKPKSTKGKTYRVFRKIETLGENTEYWYYNDYDKLQTLYPGEFKISKNNV